MSALARARDIEKYIAKQEPEMQVVLQEVRRRIRAALPDAKEAITGRKPAVRYRNPFFAYWAWDSHTLLINAVVEHDRELMKELNPYADEEGGSIWYWKFRIESGAPYELIVRMALVAATAGKKGQTLDGRDYP
jgi:uncharacterized protein YdhG (YjbR/CyaY superfamily)